MNVLALRPSLVVSFFVLVAASAGLPARARGEVATAAGNAARTAAKPITPDLQPTNHPLEPVLSYAREEQKFLHSTVRDFMCRLVKRERIDGDLQDYQFIDMKLREEVRRDGQVVSPLAIFLNFAGPDNVIGRKVLYVAGQNDGKMLVRKGGRRFEYVVADIDPNGQSAREESLVPITQSGFINVLDQMIDVLERHAKADPKGTNTKVQRIAGAKINKRPCTVIRIRHPLKQEGLEFYEANVFVDDELHVPTRVDFSLWPVRAGQPPQLLAEYTYTNLQLNVNLSDAEFDPSVVRGGR